MLDNLPQPFLLKLQSTTPPDLLNSVLDSFCIKKPTSFRINTIKRTSSEILKRLDELRISVETVPWYENALILKHEADREILTHSDLVSNGYIYIQNLSSMLPALVLNPEREDKVLDLTAAPGSKTTQLAAIMENTGEIVANDISRNRNFILRQNLKQQGVTNTQIITSPGQSLWKKYPEYFDKTLVDAPCSMEGRFYCEDEKTYKDWSSKKVKVLAKQQKWLLRSAVSATKVGGTIVYSTCTLSFEENEQVIEWLINKEQGSVALEDISLDKIAEHQKMVRIWPNNTMEGFFVAKIRKYKSNFEV